MSSLITKYRPTQFKQVIGQDAVVRSFKQSLSSGSAHTFLLHGPSGVGKTTLARIAAAQVGCREQDIEPVDAATHTGVDDMRSVTASLIYRPMGEGKVKAIIVDECHRLSGAAWDSLLTSLEEPPEWVYWFLCTTNIDKVPKTIQTRSVSYKLLPVATAELRELLEEVSSHEGLGDHLKAEEWKRCLNICAQKAKGSVREALAGLAAISAAKSSEEAKGLLETLLEASQAHELARALVARADWFQIKEILTGLKEENPENVRHVVLAYATAVIMSPKNKVHEPLLAVLDAFSQPFPAGDGLAPLVLACGKLLFE